MRNLFRLSALAIVALAATGAAAAEIRVLSTTAVKPAEQALAAEFSAQTGQAVNLSFGSPGPVQQRIAAGEAFDLIVMPTGAMDTLDKAGKLIAGSRRPLARVGIGLAVREGVKLDFATPDALRKTLLEAHAITLSDSSTGGLSGPNALKVLQNLGIAGAVKAKLIPHPSGQELIAKGEADIGLYNVSEIPRAKGVVLAGPVPAAVQVYILYDAAVPASNTAPDSALALLKFMSSPSARPRWEAAGLELAQD